MKIKITGMRNIPYEGKPPEVNKDYLVSLRAALDGINKQVSQGEENEEMTYILKVVNIEQLIEVGGRSLEIKKGFSKSQQLRFAIKDYFRRSGIDDTEGNYEKEMNKIIKKFDEEVGT